MRFNKASAVLALSLAILQPATQVAASQLTVESAVKNLQYSLNVEWDQDLKNTAVRDQAIKKFHSDLEALRKQGVSEKEILETLKSQALDENTAKELEQIAQSKTLSKEQKAKAIQDAVIKNQKSGAEWSGAATGVIIGALVIAAVVVLIISADHVSVGYSYYDPYYDPYYYDCYYDYYWGDYTCYYY